MTKKVTVLGSTGSIGTQSLDVIRAQEYSVFGLAAHSNVELLLRQVQEFHPHCIAVVDDAAADRAARELHGMPGAPVLLRGKEGLEELAAMDGSDIVLCAEENVVLSPSQFPELLDHKGEDLIVTNGKTLLGADDKAGIAEIVSAIVYLKEHPEIKHGKIRIGFNPDEEIGLGAHKFDVEKFGCDWAYTMDGGEIGELEFENFNAASAKITFKGRNVHPGYAKNKMINSIRVANRFCAMLPAHETPEHTEGYEGFYHLISFNGDVEQTTVAYIIRDHDRARFESRKKKIERFVSEINAEYGEGTATLELRDQYYNMREKIEPVMHIIDTAFAAMEAVGVKPNVKPIRGGTDGAQLSFKGLPCPNIFAGGLNFHGRYEFAPIQNMEKAMKVIVKIAELVAIK